ncbi:DUF2188 domain-containing protein [Legionella clemsonensis]|uniref:Uncharacterized protein n=1 Tax=Legionella clemsonensis TaxID=1867846 RepID=A0A222NYW9_9GAMM|nr:DUF2188 domain-containing protein [Legionella clemsonensis]ASQ44792.1 hypothetical protein clem_01130 [Legionella clemsonensis]
MANLSKPGNATGAEQAPENIKLMLEACKKFPPDVQGDEHKMEKERVTFITRAEPIGSIPLPMSLKGIVKTSFNKMWGSHPELFLDKLGERLAFERSGVRLYEATLAKALGLGESKAILQQLEHIRKEEIQHMDMLKRAIKDIGADPTAMTPGADITGVLGQGLIHVITDPRTNMAQALDALLSAELIDNAAWEILIALANDNGQDKLVEKFEQAMLQEKRHLSIIKKLLQDCLEIKLEPEKKTEKKENAYHVLPGEGGDWELRRENATRATRRFSTKQKAIAAGRRMSKNAGVELFVHQQEEGH